MILERGGRQGGPICPYLFVLSAKILGKVIREWDEVRALQVGGIETKLSQYADDTTLFLKEDVQTLRGVLDIFRWFRVVSGLVINVEKAKVINIGASRARRMTWEGQFGLQWTSTFGVMGFVFDSKDTNDITDLNI